jgi:hypothetical protein
MLRLAQTVHLSCIEINMIPGGPKRTFTWPIHLRVPSATPKMISIPIALHHKPCTYLVLKLAQSPKRPKRASIWPVSPRSSIVCAQNMHPSCVETNTISKQTKTNFHLTHVTMEVYRVWPKRFSCPWYIRGKPCTYPTLTLTPSPCGPKASF